MSLLQCVLNMDWHEDIWEEVVAYSVWNSSSNKLSYDLWVEVNVLHGKKQYLVCRFTRIQTGSRRNKSIWFRSDYLFFVVFKQTFTVEMSFRPWRWEFRWWLTSVIANRRVSMTIDRKWDLHIICRRLIAGSSSKYLMRHRTAARWKTTASIVKNEWSRVAQNYFHFLNQRQPVHGVQAKQRNPWFEQIDGAEPVMGTISGLQSISKLR